MKRGRVIDFRKKRNRSWKSFKSYIGWEDYLAVMLILLGIYGFFEEFVPYVTHLTDLFLEIRSELIGIGITVLIIDNVNEMYRRRAEKERLILQMGSPDNTTAIEAIRQLRVRGWLLDGSLRESVFIGADMSGANLNGADLAKCDMSGAILKNVSFVNTNLCGVFFLDTNLDGTNFSNSNLSGAVFIFKLTSLNTKNASRLVKERLKLKKRYYTLGGTGKIFIREVDDEDINWALLKKSLHHHEQWPKLDKEGHFPSLDNTSFDGANFDGANLSDALITEQQLVQAETLDGAIMPDGKVYNPISHNNIARMRIEAGKKPR